MTMHTDSTVINELVGTYRTFGEVGPLYHVESKADDSKVHIVVVESGEELDYSVDHALADPEAN